MKFSDISGHEDIKERLRHMVDTDHIPHALLLEGPQGASKFMLARALVQYIHCIDRHEGDSCGKCPSCIQHESFNHIDTFYSYPVVKKSGRSALSDDYVGIWRRFLKESPLMDREKWVEMLDNVNAQPKIYVDEGAELLRKLNLTAHSSKYKVVVMWQPERMQEECANKMLKLVEEPFPDTKFIMVSDDSAKILPTIYSRTQRIKVRRYSESEVLRILESHHAIEHAKAEYAAALSDGNLIKALTIAQSSENAHVYFDMFKDLMRKAYQRKVGELKVWANECSSLGRERLIQFLMYCARLVRENFILKIHNPALNALTQAEAAFCNKFSPFINERNVVDIISLLDKAIADVAANANSKIVMFDVAVKTCMLIKK